MTRNHAPSIKSIFLYKDDIGILTQEEKTLEKKFKNLSIIIITEGNAKNAVEEIKRHGYVSEEFLGKVHLAVKYNKNNAHEKLAAHSTVIEKNIHINYFEDSTTDSKIKNTLLKEIKTQWVLFISLNFLFSLDELILANDDLKHQPCSCYNFPILISKDSNRISMNSDLILEYCDYQIKLDKNVNEIVFESSIEQQPFYFSGFLENNAHLINHIVFSNIGYFDENLSFGIEVIDFSIRLRNSGLYIGNSKNSIIEKHETAQRDSNRIDKPFNTKLLTDSLNSFHDKYNVLLSDNIVRSICGKTLKELSKPQAITEEFNFPIKKPKIALIIDAENWAFANIANQLKKNLSSYYEFMIIPTQLISNLHHILMMTEGCDLVHFFWREFIRAQNNSYYTLYNKEIGINDIEFDERFIKGRKFTTTIYDHLFLSPDEILERQSFYNNKIVAYSVCSSKLFKIYNDITCYPSPKIITEDGVDLTLFKPVNLARFKNIQDRELVVGWAGNSKWAGDIEDFKGFHSILKPAIEELQMEGLNIRLELADRQNGFIPHAEMVNYYARIDLYVCPSKIEGTPNPVLESMACGVPVISTDVGVVSDAFGPLQKEWLLAERSQKALKEKLRKFYFERKSLTRNLSNENLETIKKWDWSIKSQNFKLFFDSVL
ncbi:glycosyltransferase [Citrobacter sp. S46_ASV_140]|uniref:glycosyltransferase n=1 Tax=Citrobacter sp. S46_ASV_140 TaxID=2846983 RepID=UPI001C0F2AA6|nr:glycosyltransferase [Citrobacter sp. S46_ASV_140]MBU5643081.1 glycosyltransferase [Citrobacter sp. S46_ASV_140]